MNSSFYDDLSMYSWILLITFPVWLPFVIMIIKDKLKEKRNKKRIEYAKKAKAVIKPYFDKFLKDFGMMRCFSKILCPSFCNVVEKLDKENGDIYIGELQWEILIKKIFRPRSRYSSNKNNSDEYIRVEKAITICVLYDDGFNLPDFDLSRESLKDKTIELFGMSETEDIDFDNDKEFSSAWWLTSEENMLVKDLFTTNIRSFFMNYLDKNYRICGQRNAFFIMANKLIDPDNYSQITSDIKSIARCLRSNKKFYTPSFERDKEDTIKN